LRMMLGLGSSGYTDNNSGLLLRFIRGRGRTFPPCRTFAQIVPLFLYSRLPVAPRPLRDSPFCDRTVVFRYPMVARKRDLHLSSPGNTRFLRGLYIFTRPHKASSLSLSLCQVWCCRLSDFGNSSTFIGSFPLYCRY